MSYEGDRGRVGKPCSELARVVVSNPGSFICAYCFGFFWGNRHLGYRVRALSGDGLAACRELAAVLRDTVYLCGNPKYNQVNTLNFNYLYCIIKGSHDLVVLGMWN